MTLEIIDHAYCPPESPFYAKLLRLKLESLRRHPVGYPCRYTIITVPGQELIIDAWRDHLDGFMPETSFDWAGPSKVGTLKGAEYVSLRLIVQPAEYFFQRAIGRHVACQTLLSTTKVVWFSDLDQLPTAGTLNWLCDQATAGKLPPLSYPATYRINVDHATGMRLLDSMPLSGVTLPHLDAQDFEERTGSPIGGLYFVRADAAAEGYLGDPESKWQRPTARRWWDTPDDRAYRKQHAAKGRKFEPVPAPGIYRIRHYYGHLPDREPDAIK